MSVGIVRHTYGEAWLPSIAGIAPGKKRRWARRTLGSVDTGAVTKSGGALMQRVTSEVFCA